MSQLAQQQVKYAKFDMPERIRVEKQTATSAQFIIEPFERGFGHTLGNALRRVMLASIEAPAIVSVRIEGIHQEYTAIEGIIEDMTLIILNMKGVLLRRLNLDSDLNPREIRTVEVDLDITDEKIEKGGGQYFVTAKDLFANSEFEVVTHEDKKRDILFTVTKPMSKRVTIKVGTGRGYVPSERHVFDRVVHEIVVDSTFSPVLLVNYYVENTRVGQDTDFDRLIVEVKTDGRVTPVEALTHAALISIHHFKVFEKISNHSIDFDKGSSQSNRHRDEILQKLAKPIKEIELSVRSENCLHNAKIELIVDLIVKDEAEMLKYRNFGKKSLTEIKEALTKMNLHLGMEQELLNDYGITQETLRQLTKTQVVDNSGSAEE
jgi:DNA-directed RNA polymerase subunit alpha